MRIRHTLAILICMPLLVSAFEIDDEANRLIMANDAFNKADADNDGSFSQADAKAWAAYADLDSNGDGKVDRNEFMAGARPEYPAWSGEVKRNIVYKRAGDEVLLLDVYPPLVQKYDKAPVFYFTHGGGWSGGRKEITDPIRPLFEALSNEGFVCVGVHYRLVKLWKQDDPVIMRDCVVDCRDGLRFLKKHEEALGLDMDRVAVFGSSAGGHITQLLTWSGPDDFAGDPALAEFKVKVATGVSWFGPSDFRDMELSHLDDGLQGKFSPDHWARRINKCDGEFEYNEETRRLADEVSPVVYLKKTSAPLLHIHGDQDVVISVRQARHLEEQAKVVGAPVDVLIVKGAGHGWWNRDIDPDRGTIEQKSIGYILQQIAAAPR